MREEKKKNSFNAPPRRFRDRPLFFHPRGGCLPSSSFSFSSSYSVGVVVSGFQRVRSSSSSSSSSSCARCVFLSDAEHKKKSFFFPKKSPTCLGCGKLIRGTFLCVSLCCFPFLFIVEIYPVQREGFSQNQNLRFNLFLCLFFPYSLLVG